MNKLPINTVIQGDCRVIMKTWPNDSIDTIITSPPYWGLRDFGLESLVWGGADGCEHQWGKEQQDFDYKGGKSVVLGQFSTDKTYFTSSSQFCVKCGAWLGQLGLEPHPRMFINNIVNICDLFYQKLKPTGSLWLNLGDTYFNKPKSSVNSGIKDDIFGDVKSGTGYSNRGQAHNEIRDSSNWLRLKQLLGIPWRIIIQLQDRGWILRNAPIWHKRNHMPESVTDRFTKTYEFFFFLVKNNTPMVWKHYEKPIWKFEQPVQEWFINNKGKKKTVWRAYDYYFDLDSIRQPHESMLAERGRSNWDKPSNYNVKGFGMTSTGDLLKKSFSERYHPIGKNPGDSWKYDGKYSDLRQPKEIASPRARTNDREESSFYHEKGKNPGDFMDITTKPFRGAHFAVFPQKLIRPIIKVACPPNGVVVDPFLGSGTVAREARILGRKWIGIELNPENVALSLERLRTDNYRPIPDDMKRLDDFE